MSLATLTDQERASLLRSIAATFGLSYDYGREDELMDLIRKEREDAEKYRDLCA